MDEVIKDKKAGRGKAKEKPDPKDNLAPDYGKSHEFPEENLPPTIPIPSEENDIPQGMHLDHNGNLTDLFAKASEGNLPPEEK